VADDSHNNSPGIQKRKSDHLALCASGEVEFRNKGTLLDEVALVHDALPDRQYDDIDLTTTLLGKKLRAPVVISGMTGGTPEAAAINRDLAKAANALGLGFGLGSQRAMVVAPDLGWTYRVRDVAPNALVMGNLGVVQARQMSTGAIKELCKEVGVDALCVHLATSMELIQPGGDRDFRGGRETLARLHGELGLPIVIKETGAGLSRRVGMVAKQIGIRTVDTSGAGGTSWVGVETRRAGQRQKLGEEMRDWGIPTAASVGLLSDLGLDIIATAGCAMSQDVARAGARRDCGRNSGGAGLARASRRRLRRGHLVPRARDPVRRAATFDVLP
jgi:isopentenyl-diphosphate delta-isomerase